MTQGGAISVETRINDRIRVPEVRLVGPNGEQVGIVRIEDALRLAVEADLDLVEVAPMAKPPVYRPISAMAMAMASAMAFAIEIFRQFYCATSSMLC